MMLCFFGKSSALKLTETFSVMQVKVGVPSNPNYSMILGGENDLNSDPQSMLHGLFILQSFWKKS